MFSLFNPKWLSVTALCFASLLLTACGGSDDQTSGQEPSIVGHATKGPFVQGAVVSFQGINSDGSLTDTLKTTETDDRGGFLLQGGLSYDGWVQVTVEGLYFDELTGLTSISERKLTALLFVENKKATGNVNTLTPFIAARARFLFGERTGEGFLLSDFIEQARAELAKIFRLSYHPNKLNLLNNKTPSLEKDNALLLLFSASVLKSGVDDAEFQVVIDDFKDDGEINGTGMPVFAKIQIEATSQLYLDAKTNLSNKFETAPAASPSAVYISVFAICSTFTNVCTGENNALELEPRAWTNFSFFAPKTGTFDFAANFSEYHNFNQWRLIRADGFVLAKGDRSNNWVAVSPILQAGEVYRLAINNPMNAEDYNIATVFIESASDGAPTDPAPLMLNVKQEGSVGFRSGDSDTSFYIFYVAQITESAFLDVASSLVPIRLLLTELSTPVEISIYSAYAGSSTIDIFNETDTLILTETGSDNFNIKITPPSEIILIKITNKSERVDSIAVDTDGSTPYKIKII